MKLSECQIRHSGTQPLHAPQTTSKDFPGNLCRRGHLTWIFQKKICLLKNSAECNCTTHSVFVFLVADDDRLRCNADVAIITKRRIKQHVETCRLTRLQHNHQLNTHKQSLNHCIKIYHLCEGKGLGTCYSAAYETRTAALYNLGSGSWLAWANDTVAHYAFMRPSIARDGEQLDPRCSTQTYHRSNQRTRPSPCSPWATTHFPSRWG